MATTSVLIVCFLAASASASASARRVVLDDDVCSGKEDGIYGQGCRAYTQCTGGVAEFVDCSPGVFNSERLPEPGCDKPRNTPSPCGDIKRFRCNLLKDGSYPRLDDNCESFFTCYDGKDMGTQYCNPGLVFNYLKGICNYPENVFAPCGTKGTKPEQ